MSAAAFDRIAGRYDELWSETPMGRAQRAQVWRSVDTLFQPGDCVLDIGCGTGVDAGHLASRGIRVHATDSSPAMVSACRRLSRENLTVSLLAAEEIASLPAQYDGALSDFGALNCVADLRPVVEGLAAKVRPGGYAAICVIGRFCLWETLRFAVRLQFRRAFRRFPGRAAASMGITVYYPAVSRMRALFAPEFELKEWAGVGLWPAQEWLDRACGRVPMLRALADHRLLLFVRK